MTTIDAHDLAGVTGGCKHQSMQQPQMAQGSSGGPQVSVTVGQNVSGSDLTNLLGGGGGGTTTSSSQPQVTTS